MCIGICVCVSVGGCHKYRCVGGYVSVGVCICECMCMYRGVCACRGCRRGCMHMCRGVWGVCMCICMCRGGCVCMCKGGVCMDG